MTLGQIMQVASAFTIVQSALSWMVDNYTRIAEWSASARRVAVLMNALDVLDAGADSVAVIGGLLPASPTAQSLRERMEQWQQLVKAA